MHTETKARAKFACQTRLRTQLSEHMPLHK